jgi:hypothetical protein
MLASLGEHKTKVIHKSAAKACAHRRLPRESRRKREKMEYIVVQQLTPLHMGIPYILKATSGWPKSPPSAVCVVSGRRRRKV